MSESAGEPLGHSPECRDRKVPSLACPDARDGQCDEPFWCDPGTDEVDCRDARAAGSPPAALCPFVDDGTCDEPVSCAFGTDALDCASEALRPQCRDDDESACAALALPPAPLPARPAGTFTRPGLGIRNRLPGPIIVVTGSWADGNLSWRQPMWLNPAERRWDTCVSSGPQIANIYDASVEDGDARRRRLFRGVITLADDDRSWDARPDPERRASGAVLLEAE
ncbi:MAG: hypothetical protein HYY06_14460 [Deltaproteobacteria bacterium]|nr:hypothetical protein [Deltaproteobacteria bacterium]